MRSVLGLVADAGGAAGAIDRLRYKTRAASDVIDAKGGAWSSRNGDPYDVAAWLDDRPWLPADLVPLLDCTEEQGEALLWAFGFAQADSGLWRRNADEEARLLGEVSFAGVHVLKDAGEERMRRVVREELEHFFSTGRARPVSQRGRCIELHDPAGRSISSTLYPSSRRNEQSPEIWQTSSEMPEPEYRRCDRCGGTGKVPCSGCGGTGRVSNWTTAGPNWSQHGACGGTGKLPCFTCNATGKVRV